MCVEVRRVLVTLFLSERNGDGRWIVTRSVRLAFFLGGLFLYPEGIVYSPFLFPVRGS